MGGQNKRGGGWNLRTDFKWLENDGKKGKNRLSQSIELKYIQNQSIFPWLLGANSTNNERK